MGEFKCKGTKKDDKIFLADVEVIYIENDRDKAKEARQSFCESLRKKIKDRFPDSSWIQRSAFFV